MSDNFGNGPEIERDPRRFLAQPSTALNIWALIMAFIIFCCNVSIVDVNGGCIFHAISTCGFVSFVSCIAWIHGIAFVIVDWYFPSPSGFLDTTQKRKMAVLYELGFSALWTFFFFCQWAATWAGWNKAQKGNTDENYINFGAGNAKTIIAFSFFSILTWGGKAWKSYQKYLTGNFALPQYDDEVMAGAKPFASFPAGNIQSSTFPDNEQSQIRSPAADLTYG